MNVEMLNGKTLLALAAAVVACDGPGPTGNTGSTGGAPVQLALTAFASNLDRPVFLTHPPSDPRLFAVEQPGRIQLLDETGAVRTTPFLDITDRVGSDGSEQGLLSAAFHPDFFFNGFVYVFYTRADGATVVERYGSGGANALALDPNSALTILTVEQPFANHNGGLITFGQDGMLYVGLGDGGSGGDPQGHGQNKGTLLGSLLRIDVDNPDPGLNYGIPSDNPFVSDEAARSEIWLNGVRNPWRFAFDDSDGLLYIADVGQSALEEVTVVVATEGGLNLGWNIMEGSSCFNATTCDATGLVAPALTYPNPQDGCSITGGFVYRGTAIEALQGHYFYSDFCSGFLRSFRFVDGDVRNTGDWGLTTRNASSFGVDRDGELYVLSLDGDIFKIVPAQ